ncbi:DUF2846 domain-containing protein [Lutimonas saemankumensis]|uniref:DUF2846 domain-containing protein n=1 Tax=Lutimonas saemankumensis TaxID=483016 RepID=UPI001CD4062E|nr:DUF2846 domain-containing protein [Lutimonas saemankumensis]MCA0933272.1 DUF2846 domain-containing protein [Lutimonas saemankumensis]
MHKFHVISLGVFFCLFFNTDLLAQNNEPEEGKGTVVFYRIKKFSGGAITFNIQDSERNYGPLKNGGKITVNVDPGERTFFSQVLSADAVTLNIEAGKTYYVKAAVKVGYYAGRPKLTQVDEKTAKKEMK